MPNSEIKYNGVPEPQFYCVLENDKHQAFQGPFSSIDSGHAFITGEGTVGTIYSVVRVATVKWLNTGEIG